MGEGVGIRNAEYLHLLDGGLSFIFLAGTPPRTSSGQHSPGQSGRDFYGLLTYMFLNGLRKNEVGTST